ncbi:hypothetical protein D9Q98_004396 [Chlorella vulgaris]|uniref:protein-serine/threonine phosphatase n=1 Tax=Chlorella vulgaris TaxID=3077 RepID=A0A9D4TPW3_CHLVU|nr:hypothetical protein D9Q98_004396 [Chlorella vulgaris]
MGLFDSLPAPTNQAPLKRNAESLAAPLQDSSDSKKPRGDAAANAAMNGGSGGGPAWGGSLEAASSEDKGSRLTMEDVAVIKTEAGTPSTQGCRLAFFGVFDGHGGSAVARYAAEQLHGCVMAAGLRQEADRLVSAAAAGGAGSLPATNVKQCKAAIAEGFRELDRQVLELSAKEGWQDGCTAVAVWVVGSTCLVANVGDSRCVLARTPQAAPAAAAAAQAASGAVRSPHKLQQRQRTGSNKQQLAGLDTAVQQPAQEPKQSPAPQQQQQKQQPAGEQQEKVEALKAITLTREHKAIFAQERQRIERAGSFVSSDGRLAGRVEVSRAFGDRAFKKLGMSAVPDVQAFQVSARDAFLLLACDGFWGVFSPQDAVEFAQQELVGKGNSVKQTCNRLIHEAIRERGCKDNCTVMLVLLRHVPAAGTHS